jgi:hypothetical protein
MAKKAHHVVPNPKGGWDVIREGSERASHHFQKKEDAVKKAREISRNQHTELFIHAANGTMRVKDSHGSDRYPPAG